MEQLRNDIVSGVIRPGEKLPSENELSQKYSLSRHTVRKALGILEQDGYVEAFHGRGTYCSENMRHIKKSKNIAVVTTYISDYIFPRLIQGMDNVLSESGYSIILKNTANSRQKEARCLEELLKKAQVNSNAAVIANTKLSQDFTLWGEALVPQAAMLMTIARDRPRAAAFLNFFIIGSSNHVL